MHIYDNYVYYANNSSIAYFEFDWSNSTTNPTINNVTINNYSNVYKVEGFGNKHPEFSLCMTITL